MGNSDGVFFTPSILCQECRIDVNGIKHLSEVIYTNNVLFIIFEIAFGGTIDVDVIKKRGFWCFLKQS